MDQQKYIQATHSVYRSARLWECVNKGYAAATGALGAAAVVGAAIEFHNGNPGAGVAAGVTAAMLSGLSLHSVNAANSEHSAVSHATDSLDSLRANV